MGLAESRKDYALAGLLEKDLARDPFRQFDKWFQEAEAAQLPEPNAMVCALASPVVSAHSASQAHSEIAPRCFGLFMEWTSLVGCTK